MKRKVAITLLGLSLLGVQKARADEGMWLMQQLGAKYPTLKDRGLKLSEQDLYNPEGKSLKDAVVIFGRGCTGELISPAGLVLTNHHCGFDNIQSLSSVEHNYIADGYWAQRQEDELPAKGLTVTFIDRIDDVTDFVKQELSKSKEGSMDYLSPKYLQSLVPRLVKSMPYGTTVEIQAFYEGNKYLMFTKRTYSDVRFVGAPPRTVGSFGADTDNWAYPRHSADFALFRIYADEKGNPAPYSASNVPLKTERFFKISTAGVKEGDFAMIMGFPGRTNHFYLPREVEEQKSIDNDIRIKMRAIRQEVMLKEMLADEQTNIMYAAKYAGSQNAYKRAIGANWGIEARRLDEDKHQQMQSLLDWASKRGEGQYQSAVERINTFVEQRAPLRRRQFYLQEGIQIGIELSRLPYLPQKGKSKKEKAAYQTALESLHAKLETLFTNFYNQDYSPEVDRKIALAMLTEYCQQIAPDQQPKALREGIDRFGSLEAYVNALYAQSLFTSKERFEAYKSLSKAEQIKSIEQDLGIRFASSVKDEAQYLVKELAPFDDPISLARRTYVAGILEQSGGNNVWADANFTLRFTYGNVKGYTPKDGVYYGPQTYLDGVMEKNDPTSWEFAVPKKLQEIYSQQSYGKGNRWAVKQADGSYRMPVNMAVTTHTTGGNSGSPVFDGNGNLIGINFDRNWEGVGGDIQYLPDYQRSIVCDIRYILMLIEEYGQCQRIIDELILIP